MATHPTRPRGAARIPKRPNTSPMDRGRIAAVEQAVEELKGEGGGE